jgi:hypothetical protein
MRRQGNAQVCAAFRTEEVFTMNDDEILRGLKAIAEKGLNGKISPRALYAMIARGHLKGIRKVAGKYTSTPRRMREMFESMMDGKRC